MKNIAKKAVILLSGGIDSSVCLALAIEQGYECYALSIDYQQRNRQELNYAVQIAKHFNVQAHRIITLAIGHFGGSALTDASLTMPDELPANNSDPNDIPITYVPARNTIFLATALGWAETVSANHIFIGANSVDSPNYPDCRPEYFQAFTQVANLATRTGINDPNFQIHTPLINMDKATIIREGLRLGVDFNLTFSCYNPTDMDKACETCLACRVRAHGFADFA